MIIDGHCHASGKYLTGEGILGELQKNGADKVVLTSGEKSGHTFCLPNLGSLFPQKDINFGVNKLISFLVNTFKKAPLLRSGNERVYQLAQKYPKQIIQSYWADPVNEKSEDLEKKFALWHFRGVKLHQCVGKSFSFDSAGFLQLTEWAHSHSLPVFIHPSSPEQVNLFIRLIKNKSVCCRVVIGHLIGYEIFEMEFGANTPDNLFFDISCPPIVSSYRMLKAIQKSGASHVVMGSDTPYGSDNLKTMINRITSFPLNDYEKEQVLGGTLSEIIG